MRRLNLHLHLHLLLRLTAFIRQRIRNIDKLNKKFENLQHQEEYLEMNIEYRKLEKFSISEKINSKGKITVYRIP